LEQTFGWSDGKDSNGEPGTEQMGMVSFTLISPEVAHVTI